MWRLLLIVLISIPSVASAQETVDLSETQRSFNEKGVTAIRDGEYATAISNFESSLTLGEANITYLNLGRAYQRAGHCMKAKEAYSKVSDAPAVAAPSRDELLDVLGKYAGELPELCPAVVQVVCDDPQTQITVDGGEPQRCSATIELSLSAGGAHRIVGKLGQKRVVETVEPAEGENLEVVIEFPAEESPPARPQQPAEVVQQPSPSSGPSTLRMIGLVTGAAGAATLTAAFINDLTYVRGQVEPCLTTAAANCDPEKARRSQRINAIVFSVGGGLAIGGLILYLAGGSSDSGVGLQYDGGPGIAWKTRF